MTKAEFRDWLQAQLAESDCHEEHGDTWREIEAEGLLPEGVTLAVDRLGSDFIFGLDDGLLASGFEYGVEQETIWFFAENDVDANLRDYSVEEAEAALRGARAAASELDAMLAARSAGVLPATPPGVWVAAAAYGDRDYGEGHTRLFTRAYDHQPTEAEVRGDAFVEAVPDWQQRYVRYALDAAAYEWEGSLEDALTIEIIPAIGVEDPPTDHLGASPNTKSDDAEQTNESGR